MLKADLILLHAPSVYDFRKRTAMYGPISDLIPSSPMFEMYPVGFISIAEYLGRAGYTVRIVNLANRMLSDPGFDAEKAIQEMHPKAFGIDLHWLPHAHGAIEIARLVKKHHTHTPVVMGGIASSYYYKELLNYPEVDYVIRGDTTEEPFRQLMDCIAQGRPPETVPNLMWRDAQGQVRENDFSHVPASLDGVFNDCYNFMFRSVLKHRDIANFMPFKRWLDYPITAVLTCRGCTRNCAFCGGSNFAFKRFMNRQAPAYRTPEAVARDVSQIQRLTRGPIFILGDIRQPGEDYADRLLHLLGKEKPKNRVIMELFTPASPEFLRKMGEACPGFCLEISPESHDPEVRKAIGKDYTNQGLEQTIEGALSAGCQRVDIFLLIGLTKQTPESALASIDYCDALLGSGNRRVAPFISPLVPFLDPGSLAYEHADHYGYKLFCHTLEDHRKALEAPSWKYMMSYETKWMTRDDIANTSYEAALRLNRLKAKHGFISAELADATERRTQSAIAMLHRIDQLVEAGCGPEDERFTKIRQEVAGLNESTVCEKKELELPVGFFKLNPLRALLSLVLGR